MPLGPTANYLARYNGYQLPGYVQSESLPSEMNIAEHPAPYVDGSNSEALGLSNKLISLTLKVWEADYQACKDQVQKAATILRTKRSGFAPLYVQYSDRYYEAMPTSIRMEQTTGKVRTLEYNVEFHCKPWLVDTTEKTITGTSLGRTRTFLSTSARTIDDGGWTFATVTLTGNDITLSGYTDTEPCTGFISVSGTVTNLIIDSENFTATEGGTNRNANMRYADYRMFAGPETTTFVVSGATACEIKYRNRWYI